MLKILGDDVRLTILHALSSGPLCVGEMNAAIGISQNLMSHHLKLLKTAGLVTSKRVGKKVMYQRTDLVDSVISSDQINLGCCQLVYPKDKKGKI